MACKPAKDGSYLFSAYRVHTDDPLFVKPSSKQTWRDGDTQGCVLDDSLPFATGTPPNVTASAFVLMYEW